MEINIEIDDSEVTKALRNLQAAADDMTPVMRDIAGVLADSVEESFEQETDLAANEKWPDLKDKTKLAREKQGKWPGRMLQVSGQLAASIQSEYGPDFAAVGTNKIYAATHQFGDPNRNIPARPFLGIGQDDRDEILDIIKNHLRVS